MKADMNTVPNDYLAKILTAQVYDVAIESPLELAPLLSRRLHNRLLLKLHTRRSSCRDVTHPPPSRLTATAPPRRVSPGRTGLTSNNRPASNRPAPRAAARPIAMPIDARRQTLAQHQPQHLAAIGAERHPHAELVRPLRHRVRVDAEHADRREHEREPAEAEEQHHQQPLLSDAELDDLRQRAHVVHRKIRIDLVNRRLAALS